MDERTPLLERVKFLAIVSTNLDEFFMVRVAGVKRQVAARVTQPAPDGLTPTEQLDAIRRRVADLFEREQAVLADLLDLLGAHDIRLVDIESLSAAEFSALDDYFEREVFPVLTPLALDPGHPFPYISNLSVSLAVRLRDPSNGSQHLARVKVPKSLPRFVPISGSPTHFVPLEQVIGANLGALFPGYEVVSFHSFRLTRYSDLEIATAEEPEDLLATIEEQVFQRRFGEVVRLEIETGMPDDMRELLIDELRAERSDSAPLSERDVFDAGPLLDLGDLHAIAALDIPELKYPPFQPTVPVELRSDRSIFDVIRNGDVLIHHPFDSFPASVERFLDEAANDPNVLAIKMTLYRTSGDTAIVDSLIRAAQQGKQVAVLVELKARFDEANNISWARTLEDYGIHVAYGSAALKIHTKTALVVRREPDGIRRYVHLGTGNYNSRTAKQYTDIGLLTCSPSIGADVSDLFNSLTGYSRQRLYRKLIVAPTDMRTRFLELIQREADHARAGRPAHIIAKMNALVDPQIIDALYAASQAGMRIHLLVRGICCLRPEVKGMSEHIRVVSIIGRFLEHSRIFYFANGGTPEYYVGSADWMPRNFDRRVEAIAPVERQSLHERLHALLEMYLADNRQAWELQPNGQWQQRQPVGIERASHGLLLVNSWGIVEGGIGAGLGL
jgi:polyphosphate kinase